MNNWRPLEHVEPSYRCQCRACTRARWLAYDRECQETDDVSTMTAHRSGPAPTGLPE